MKVNIGSDNGLVPSGNQPLPKLMVTTVYVAIWCHKATMSKSKFVLVCSYLINVQSIVYLANMSTSYNQYLTMLPSTWHEITECI